jgi:hypothetical protein
LLGSSTAYLTRYLSFLAKILHYKLQRLGTSVFYFIYFEHHRKQSSLEGHSYLHPLKWMKHTKYRWNFISSSKSMNIHLKRSNTIPRFYSNLAISSSGKGLIYCLKKNCIAFWRNIAKKIKKSLMGTSSN